jgi:glycine/D-amino acid oxidase-like deaminating enzyme
VASHESLVGERGRGAAEAAWDLLVVGGGVIGLAAAWLATHDLDWRVLVVERDLVGGGATGRSLGVEVPFGRDAEQREVTREALRLWAAVQRRVPDLARRSLDSAWLVPDDGSFDGSTFVDPPPRPATEHDRHRLAAALPGSRLTGGRLLVGGPSYQTPPAAAARLLARQVESGGGAVWEGCEAGSVESVEHGLELRLGDGRRVAARRVLLAPGPWASSGPASELAAAQRLRIKKVVALHVQLPPPRDAPLVFLWAEDAFLLPDPVRRCWRFSFTCQQWDCLPEASRLVIGPADRQLALELLERYWPPAVAHCGGGQVFCDAYAPDWVPRVERDPRRPGVVFAGAGAGSGFRLAPALARRALAALGGTPCGEEAER